MITADTLKTLTEFGPKGLTTLIQQAGYKEDEFTSCKFLGLTNGGQFCYFAVFHVKGGTDSCKVYLTYKDGKVTAGY